LTISVAEREGVGLIAVSDTGSGMTAETRQRLFEPFYTTKEVGRGSGLGLSQVYGFLKQSGGTVEIDSVVGEGSTFRLTLPVTDRRPQPAATDCESVAAQGGSERVLIVEDDPAVLSVCLDMLQSLGYRCEVAVDAAGALARLSERRFDLLFSDVVMPGGVNGIELARRATAAHPGLEVLLTSGYVGEAALEDPHDFAVIDKPYEHAELAARLRGLLDAGKLSVAI
jgi:CheY-like chemotaxis protein